MLARIATSEKEVGLRAALTAVLSELACTFLQSTRERAAIMYKFNRVGMNIPSSGLAVLEGIDG